MKNSRLFLSAIVVIISLSYSMQIFANITPSQNSVKINQSERAQLELPRTTINSLQKIADQEKSIQDGFVVMYHCAKAKSKSKKSASALSCSLIKIEPDYSASVDQVSTQKASR